MKHIHGTSLPCSDIVLTIGKFEGIHLGHVALIKDMVKRAKELGLPSVVLAFEPHPFEVLSDADYKPLYTLNERTYLLDKVPGVDFALTYPFTKELADITPEGFCSMVFENLRAREVFVGENFGFGSRRSGNASFLKERARVYGARVHVAGLMHDEGVFTGQQISTSNIRDLVIQGKLQEARSQLGHPFFMIGETVVGRQIGRVMGFPTLNIIPPVGKFLPQNGVYSTVTTIDGVRHPSITNIGLNPTINTTSLRTVETHVLDAPESILTQELYGHEILLEVTSFLRPEMKFASRDELVRQISLDIHKLGLQNPNGTVKIDKQEPGMFDNLLF